MRQQSAADSEQSGSRLLQSIAEQLMVPLTIISREAELAQLGQPQLVDAVIIQTQAAAAINLVESYLLGLQLMQSQTTLDLEPVSVSSLLSDVAHRLHDFAKQYDTLLEVHIAGKYEPVMAHRAGLDAAFLAVGYTLLEAYPLKSRRLTLAVHRTAHGLSAGMYGKYEALSGQQWRQALALQGRAGQTMPAMCVGSGAGLFVAETILQAMAARLYVGRYRKQQGLATILQPSQQLQLV